MSKKQHKVDNAVILAAGFGSRFVPLTYEKPKGLLEVFDTPMVERQIEQLLDANIKEIYIVVGYMKEEFEYLIDKYGVTLIYNPEFAVKNNLTSLYYAREHLKNTYILMADNWIENSIFNSYELNSWFSCLYFEDSTAEWCVTDYDENDLIKKIEIGGKDSWAILGPSFFTEDFSSTFKSLLVDYYNNPISNDFYWEHILKENIDKLPMYMNKQNNNVYEFECLEELREYDKSYINNAKSDIMDNICEVFNVEQSSITDIEPLKAGVTNDSFIYMIDNKKYVYRIPGTGTDKLIKRDKEKKVYELISDLGFSDVPVYFNEKTGIKITEFFEGSRIADPWNNDDLRKSMETIKKIHEEEYNVEHGFDIDDMIDYYYSLADKNKSIRFSDIKDTKKKVLQLLKLREKLSIKEILCHGDFAHTNVLILKNGDCKIIDWEYSGIADPIMDVAMYGIYAELPRERIELGLKYYLEEDTDENAMTRLYLYTALGGFLWSMWSQYKQGLGQEFGEYPLKMYRYMKDFYKILNDKKCLDD